jgi:uncharacterized protein (DUF1330 family)
MPAYPVSEVEMRDAAAFEACRTVAAKAVAQNGCRYWSAAARQAW